MAQPQAKIGWSFKPGNMWDGWNDSAIATFRNKILESLTREIIQNSLDAAESPNDPVYIDFDEIKMSRDDIPNIDQLKETLDRCWKVASKDSDKTRSELRTAIDTVSKSQIPILRIADEGTTGMPGPCRYGTPFFSYLKARGQSGGSDSRGGSHGIGKAAPLCASNLRTIFVSSKWKAEDTGDEQAMIQGRSTLMSHYDVNETQMAGIGFWGKTDGDDAVLEEDCEFDWLKREEIGTSVFVVGWNRSNTRDWKSYIIAWAAVNYFTAFHRERLVLNVDGNELDASNIGNVLSNDRYHELLKAEQKGHRLTDARYYFRCLSDDDEVKKDETELLHIGHSKLRMIVDEGAPRKIAIIRKNMLITDSLDGYWVRPPNRLQDFAGVFECVNDEGEKLIRAMEPPAHDDLSKDYLPVDERDRGASALKALANKLRELTEKHAASETQEAGEVDFLREFFSDEAGDGDSDQELEDRDPAGKFVVTPKPVKLPPPKPVILEPEVDDDDDDDESPDENFPGEDGGAGTDGGGGGGSGGDGPGRGPNEGGSGDRGNSPRPLPNEMIALNNCRFVRISENKFRLLATPTASGKLSLGIYEVGADSDEEINVISSDMGSVEDGLVITSVKKGKRLKIMIELDRDVVGGLKPIAGAYRGEQ